MSAADASRWVSGKRPVRSGRLLAVGRSTGEPAGMKTGAGSAVPASPSRPRETGLTQNVIGWESMVESAVTFARSAAGGRSAAGRAAIDTFFVVLLAADPDGRAWILREDLHLVRRSVRAAHPAGLLIVTSPDRSHLVLVLPGSRGGAAPVDAGASAEQVRATLAGAGRQVLVTVAVAPRCDHVPVALAEARTVLWVVRAVHHPPGTYRLDDVLIEAAVLRSPDIAARLATRLAPLASSGAPLLETLRSFLASGHDRQRTARRMHIHPNTLIYRLRRIRELTGLSPTRPADIQTLGAALAAWQVLGEDTQEAAGKSDQQEIGRR